MLEHSCLAFVLSMLVDSGAAENFIDERISQKLGLPVCPLLRPRELQSIDGTPIGGGVISHSAWPISIQVSALHHETIILCLTVSTRHPVILGLPWLARHSPQISWADQQITQWSPYCVHNCLRGPTVSVATTTVESPLSHVPVNIPP